MYNKHKLILILIMSILILSFLLFSYSISGLNLFQEEKVNFSFGCLDYSQNQYGFPYIFEPNCEMKYGGYWVYLPPVNIKINSDGFRDKEYSLDKHLGVYRIIMIGDSFTMGYGVEIEDSFSKVLEKKLKKRGKYEVMNLGVIGYSLREYINFLKYKGLKYSPDLVIFNLIRDDIVNNSYKLEYQYDCESKIREGIRNVSRQENIGCNQKAIKAFKSYFDNLSKEEQLKEYRLVLFELRELSEEYGFKILLNNLDCPGPNDRYSMNREFYNRLIDFLEKNDFEFLDCDPRLTSEKYTFKGDGHPNKKGHELIAEKIYNSLIKE